MSAFEKAGFQVENVSGSHHVMKKEGHPNLISVPVHAAKNVGVGLLSALIRDAGLTKQEFIDYL